MKPLRLVKAEAEAVDRLVDLIKEHNKWVEPELNELLATARRVENSVSRPPSP